MSSIKAILLEDDPNDAKLVVLELEKSGFEVDWQRVETPHDFEAALHPNVDLILADFSLPQFDALTALTVAQQQGFDVPFIIVSGTVSEEIAVACMRQGAADYLLKDRLSRLGEAVRQALAQHRLRREQEQSQRELRIMSRAINSSSEAIVFTDLSGTITFVNDAFLRLWNYPAGETATGSPLARLWQPESLGISLFNEALLKNSVSGELESIDRYGQQLNLRYSISKVLDFDGSPINLMSVFLDVTEQKQADRARREAEVLRLALKQEKEVQELKSSFLSMVVHDFRSPLAVMLLNLTTLRSMFEHMTPEKRLEKIDVSIVEVRRLTELMDDVLTISRMESATSSFNPNVADAISFCREVFDAFGEANGKRHRLVFQSQVESMPLSFDAGLMRRVLVNLLSNAVKYSPQGTTVLLNLYKDSNDFWIEIIDQGIGIPERDVESIFDTFHRADNAHEFPGTGLGLAIVKYGVKLHGGTVVVDSVLSKGTKFNLSIPVR